jgi:hypothetical protein
MTDKEYSTQTPDERVVQRARVWRDRDKAANARPCNDTKRAEYFARRQLREAVDQLEQKRAAE